MEIVVIIIMLLVGFGFLLKLTYLPALGSISLCAVCAVFTAMCWELAAGQSKSQISDWLQSPELMLDVAVLLTIDVFMQVVFCVFSAKRFSGVALSKTGRVVLKVTQWIPGILIFPTLFAMLVEVIFAFPGVDFAALAWSLSAGVFIAGVSLPVFVKWILPEADLRLELIFMVNALIAVLGVVATVNGRTAVSGTDAVDWSALLGVAVLLIIGAAVGLLLFKRGKWA